MRWSGGSSRTSRRFAEDRIEVNRSTFLAGEAPSVPLVEVREA
jgi:hypothetical protein